MNRITLNTALQIATRIIEFASGIVVNAWLARNWGSSVFGQIGLFMSLTTVFLFLFDFGLSNLLVRTLARAPGKVRQVVLNGSVAVTGLSLVGGSLMLGVGLTLTGGRDAGILLLGCLQLYFTAQALILRSSFYASERMEFECLPVMIERFGWLAAGLWLALQPPSLLGLFACITLTKGLGLLVSLLLFLRCVSSQDEAARLDPAASARLIRESLPFGLNLGFASLVAGLDILFLSHWSDADMTGQYRAVGLLIIPLGLVATALINALYPRMSAAALAGAPHVATFGMAANRILMRLAIPASLLMLLYAPEIVLLIFGPDYLSAAPLLQILSLSLPVRFLANSLGTVLTACDRQGRRMACGALAAGFNLIVNLLVIPRWHAVGACITLVLTDVVLALAFWRVIRETAPMREAGGQAAIQSLVLSASILGPLYGAGAPLLLACAIFAIAYPSLTLLLRSRLLSPLEVQLLWRPARP